ncbi:hypothetical protein U1Q18_008206 [Sarracenia purpurea var. burkii]
MVLIYCGGFFDGVLVLQPGLVSCSREVLAGGEPNGVDASGGVKVLELVAVDEAELC